MNQGSYTCERCGDAIGEERVANALAFRRKPTYCSSVCGHRARNSKWYETRGKIARKTESLLKARRKRRPNG